MKRSSRFNSLLCVLSVVAIGALAWAGTAQATDGTWNTTDPNLWSAATGGVWLDDIIADGSGATANFNALDVAADANATVHLDTPRTIGNLIFGDTDTGTAGGWILDDNGNAANILTLAGTTPTITVNALGTGSVATINAVIAGADGLAKAGDGTLVLAGANTYTGATTVTGGTLQYSTALTPATDSIVINGGGISIDDDVSLALRTGNIQFASINSIGKTGTMGAMANVSGTPITITVNPGITGTIDANMNISGIGSEGSPALVMGGGGDLNIGGVVTADQSSTPVTKGYISWDGGGTLTVSGVLNNQYLGGNAQTDKIYIGDTVASTVNVTGRLLGNSLYIGRNTVGGSTMNVTGPGDYTTPTVYLRHNNIFLFVGGSSSNNSLNVTAGAFLRFTKGNGTNYVSVGQNAGAEFNSLNITGPGAGYYDSGNLYIGKAGSNNSMTVSAGGSASPGRLFVGETGSNNSVLITGVGSSLTPRVDHNTEFAAGSGAGGSNNSITIQDGASAVVNGTRDTRSLGIGMSDGANDNAILVDGADSSLTLTHVGTFVIGGRYNADSTASGNHLDVYGGATASLRSVVLKGVNSAFNLGDGIGISEATLGVKSTTAGVLPGITLSKADSRLNINSGRLIAIEDDANMVKGPGKIDLTGPAYVSTPTAIYPYEITSDITGIGSLTKEGDGALVLFGNNDYTGDTIVKEGTLIVSNEGAGLDDLASVMIEVGATMDLSFAGVDTIDDLWLGGTQMGLGNYNSTTHPAYFITNSGTLRVFPSSLLGDTNGDGLVNAADYIALKTNMGLGSGAALADGDLDNDGDVDFDDLQILQDNYVAPGGGASGSTASSPPSGTVPEPATLGLLALGAMAVIRRRRG